MVTKNRFSIDFFSLFPTLSVFSPGKKTCPSTLSYASMWLELRLRSQLVGVGVDVVVVVAVRPERSIGCPTFVHAMTTLWYQVFLNFLTLRRFLSNDVGVGVGDSVGVWAYPLPAMARRAGRNWASRYVAWP